MPLSPTERKTLLATIQRQLDQADEATLRRVQTALAGQGADPETKKVEMYYERFSEQPPLKSTTKAALVNGYKAERKLKPGLTAAEFLHRDQ